MQDRLTYANGNTITTEGFRCTVGEPIDIKVTVGEDKEVDLQGESGKNIPYGDYLITLEVNGEKAAYRDLYHLGDPVTVEDYTISDDMYLADVSEGDEVVMRLEPVELMVTDAFRAAVKSLGGAASESSGGGTGGGVLVVTDTNGTLDKTWQEIADACATTGAAIVAKSGDNVFVARTILDCLSDPFNGKLAVKVLNGGYVANTTSDYPTAGG